MTNELVPTKCRGSNIFSYWFTFLVTVTLFIHLPALKTAAELKDETPNIHNAYPSAGEWTNPEDLLTGKDIKSNKDEKFEIRFKVAPQAGQIICRVYVYIRPHKLATRGTKEWDRGLFADKEHSSISYWDWVLDKKNFDWQTPAHPGSDWTQMKVKEDGGNWENFWNNSADLLDGLGPLWKYLNAKTEGYQLTNDAEILFQVIWATRSWKHIKLWKFAYYYKTHVTHIYETKYCESPRIGNVNFKIIDNVTEKPVILESSDADKTLWHNSSNQYHYVDVDLPSFNDFPIAKVQYRFTQENGAITKFIDGYSNIIMTSNEEETKNGIGRCKFRIPTNKVGTYELKYIFYNHDNDREKDSITSDTRVVRFSRRMSPDREYTEYNCTVVIKKSPVQISKLEILDAKLDKPDIDRINNSAKASKFTPVLNKGKLIPVETLLYGQDRMYMINFLLQYPQQYDLLVKSFQVKLKTIDQNYQTWSISGGSRLGQTVVRDKTKYCNAYVTVDSDKPVGFFLQTQNSTLENITLETPNVMHYFIWNYFDDSRAYRDFYGSSFQFDTGVNFELVINYQAKESGEKDWSPVLNVSKEIRRSVEVPRRKSLCVEMMRNLSLINQDLLLSAIGSGLQTTLSYQAEHPVETIFELDYNKEEQRFTFTKSAKEYFLETIWDVTKTTYHYYTLFTFIMEHSYNNFLRNAKDPLDFQMDKLFYPEHFTPVGDTVSVDFEDIDDDVEKCSQTIADNHYQLSRYYEALYHTTNRLNTARLYGTSKEIENQLNHYKNLIKHAKKLENDLSIAQTDYYKKDAESRLGFNVRDYLQSVSVGSLFQDLKQNRDELFNPKNYAGLELTDLGLSETMAKRLKSDLLAAIDQIPEHIYDLDMNAWDYFKSNYINGFSFSSAFIPTREAETPPRIIAVTLPPQVFYDSVESPIAEFRVEDLLLDKVFVYENGILGHSTTSNTVYIERPQAVGRLFYQIKATNKAGLSTIYEFDFEVMDDDITAPDVSIEILSTALNDTGGMDLTFKTSALDSESGIDTKNIVISKDGQIFSSLGIHTANLRRYGSHTIDAAILNSDLDRGKVDQEIGRLTLNFELTDEIVKEKVLQEMKNLTENIKSSSYEIWKSFEDREKIKMRKKLEKTYSLIEKNEFSAAYKELMVDIKPKLTGYTTNDKVATWEEREYKNPWIVDQTAREEFRILTNRILHALVMLY